jgi:hypothetical protein
VKRLIVLVVVSTLCSAQIVVKRGPIAAAGGAACTTPTYTLTKVACTGTNACTVTGTAAGDAIVSFSFESNASDSFTGASDGTNGSYTCNKPTFVSSEQLQACYVINSGSGSRTVTAAAGTPSGQNSYAWLIHPSCGTVSLDTSAVNGASCDGGTNTCTFPSVTVASANSIYVAATWGSQWVTPDINMTHEVSDGVVGFGEMFSKNTIGAGAFAGSFNISFNINTRPVVYVFHAN